MKSLVMLKREEIANAITHGVGAMLAISALVLLIVFSALQGTAWHVSSFTIFGSSMVILYVMSTLYHSLTHIRAKKLFQKFDHMSIFLLIAGTYTPFCLTALRGWLGWTIFGIVWACAIGGIVIKAFHTGKAELISTILYIVMGWIIIFFIRPVYESMSPEGFSFLLLGGVFYTLGAFFFMREKMPYNHSIWHLFVLAGSTFHFFAVMSLL
ncbi:MAG TPA: hemolysin III family protein [Chryseolinea sp.]|nr:hemolysin III family protein [Chryseolinea sp.]